MRDEASSNAGSEQSLQVGRDLVKLLVKVSRGVATVISLLDDKARELVDDLEISAGEIISHGNLGGINDGLGLLTVLTKDSGDVVQLLISEGLLVSDDADKLSVGVVV